MKLGMFWSLCAYSHFGLLLVALSLRKVVRGSDLCSDLGFVPCVHFGGRLYDVGLLCILRCDGDAIGGSVRGGLLWLTTLWWF